MELRAEIYKQVRRLDKLSVQRVHSWQQFHASEAGDCSRAIFMRKMGVPSERKEANKDKESQVSMLLADGRMHQEQLTKYIYQVPGVHITNIEQDMALYVPIGNGDHITILGHPDGILHFVKDNTKNILEVKGLSTFTCKKLKNGDVDTLKEAYPKAIPQARIYTRMFRTNGARVIVKDKDNASLYEFYIPVDDEITNKIIEKFLDIARACIQKDEEIIKCNYMAGDKRSNFCPYKSQCGYGR